MSNESMNEVVAAFNGLAEVCRKVQETIRSAYGLCPEPVKAEQPDRFEYRDIDGDRVLVYPHVYPEFQSLLMVETDGDSVRLSQEAVNGLAQYLDRYRTDVPCPEIVGIPEGEECAGTQHHDGPCSPDADDIGAPVPAFDLNEFYCAGYDSQQPPRKTGCGHPRDSHGALGCNISFGDGTQCPCERRNGS